MTLECPSHAFWLGFFVRLKENIWENFRGRPEDKFESKRLDKVGDMPRMPRALHPRFVIATFIAALVLASLDVSAENTLQAQVERARSHFTERDPSLTRFFEEAYAYALFPRIKKGAIGLGGAYGKGLVYQLAPQCSAYSRAAA